VNTVAPRVAIVVVHWRGLDDTLACVEALRAMDYPDWTLILVLNGAADGDRLVLEGHIPARAEIIQLPENRGFAGGSNAGIVAAGRDPETRYVLLLNNDTVVQPDFLWHLVSRAESGSDIGIVGGKTYFHGTSTIQFTRGDVDLWRGRTFNRGAGRRDDGEFDAAATTGYVHGACLLFRSELIGRIGPLDERFFAYWEETDFCCRARTAGFRVVYEPQAVIWHKGGRSSASATRLYFLLRNNIYFMQKHARWYHWLTFLPYFVLRTTPLQSARPLLESPTSTIRSVASAYRHGFAR
jgi:GT2 family glycosyltransferase